MRLSKGAITFFRVWKHQIFLLVSIFRTNQLVKLQTFEVAHPQKQKNAKQLLDAELINFELGSATIFMVNYRERYYLETRLKLVEVLTKYLKSKVGVRYAVGNLGL